MTRSHFAIAQALAAAVVLGGVILFLWGQRLPVYTDPRAPEMLSQELRELPGEERSAQWHLRLPAYETAHKRLTDVGRGLGSLGLGISAGAFFLRGLARAGAGKVSRRVWVYWTALWLAKFPLTVWYYMHRYKRFDYPVWADSFVIGVMGEWIAWVMGFAVFSLLLAWVGRGHPMASVVALRRPEDGWSRVRAVVLWAWVALLVLTIYPAVWDGDEGMVFPCTAALPVLLLALSARRRSGETEVPGGGDAVETGAATPGRAAAATVG